MSVLYVIRQLLNPQDRGARPKFYLKAKIRGHKSHKDILQNAARNTTINPIELDMAVNAWFEEVVRALEDGFSVEVTDLGHFTVSIRSEGSDTEEEVSANKKKNIALKFIPSGKIRNTVNRFSLEKFNPNKTL
jgi:predicted histone-like DNA-binding protein